MWEGLTETERFELSTAILLNVVGQESAFKGVAEPLWVHQAIWVQFHESHGVPPSTNRQLKLWIKANLVISAKQFVTVLTHDRHCRNVKLFASRKALRNHLGKRKNRMDRQTVKDLKLNQFLVVI